MATGALDANGIWQYGEDDSEATFSALLNKVAGSTSTQVGTIKRTGRIVQELAVSRSALVTVTSAAGYVDYSELTLTITPTSATSKIEIQYSCGNVYCSNTGFLTAVLHKNGVSTGANTAPYMSTATARVVQAFAYVETSGTTSAITYSIKIATQNGTAEYGNGSLVVKEIQA